MDNTVPEKTEEIKSEEKKDQQGIRSSDDNQPISALWGDSRFNPLFLKVAEYFGVDEKTYADAEPQIKAIIDWAAEELHSKNSSDILLKVAETSKNLQSPGFSERAYAILYRYIKLSAQKKPVEEQINKLRKERENIEKEMQAYRSP